MSFKSPEFSIDNATEHEVRLTGDLADFANKAEIMRSNCDTAIKQVCFLTDKAALFAAERSA